MRLGKAIQHFEERESCFDANRDAPVFAADAQWDEPLPDCVTRLGAGGTPPPASPLTDAQFNARNHTA
jgi:hypothetical protein